MDVVDELMTPGCPQCAVKHLSAALAYAAMRVPYVEKPVSPSVSQIQVLTARAYINLGEVLAGYRSHLWFAAGLLQAAEEADLAYGGTDWKVIRTARFMLTGGADDIAVRDAMVHIDCGMHISFGAFERAHREEAFRELPGWTGWTCDYERDIQAIRHEYFANVSNEASAASSEDAEKGGEKDMATKKATAKKAPAKKAPAKKAPAFLKKADPKAAKAACKGGKCTGGKKCK